MSAQSNLYPRSQAIFLLGEAMSLVVNSKAHDEYSVGELKTRFITPIMLDQFRIYRGKQGPVGIVTWAAVADDISEKLVFGHTLTPSQIKSGRNIWLLEFIAPFGHARKISQDLRDNIFPGRRVNAVRRAAGRGRVVKLIVRPKQPSTTTKLQSIELQERG